MLSYAAIVAPHESQWERPPTNDSPRGSLWATTPAKLPKNMPPTKAIGASAVILSSCRRAPSLA